MEFIIVLIFLCVLYCTYNIYKLKEESQKEVKEVVKEENKVLMNERLSQLINKRCELIMNEVLVFIDAMYNVQGTIVDVDDEWVVMISEKNKKTVKRVIRLSSIKSVKEIIS